MEPPYPDLSREDDKAFLQLEREFRQTLDDDVRRDGRDPVCAQLAYVNKVFAAADALGVETLAHLTRPEHPISKSADNLHYLRDEVDQALVVIRLKQTRTPPAPPTILPEDRHQRLGVLIGNIQTELAQTPMPADLRDEAGIALDRLIAHHTAQRVKMEDFVDLGRAIAGIGRIPATEAVADKCWRWLRIAMGLARQSPPLPHGFAPVETDHPAPPSPPPSQPQAK